jgi:MYXO-CTERM domain-containing protein
MPFVYPPHWAPIAMAFGLLPWPLASRLWDVVSVGAFFASCALCLELTSSRLRGAIARPEVWCFIALAALNPSVKYSVSHSQMTVLATLGVTGAFWAFRQHRHGWLAVFAFVAALKPQLGFLALVYIFVNGGHVGILRGAGAAIAVASLAVLPNIAELPAHLARASELHLQLSFNAPDRFANLPTLAASRMSGREFMMLGAMLALLAVAALTLWRRRSPKLADEPLLELAVICALTAALMPVHTYDLVIYVPIAILACGYRSSRLGLLLIPLYLLAGRAHVLGRFVPVNDYHLTGLMAVVTLALAGRRRATDSRVATPVANELARTAPAQVP